MQHHVVCNKMETGLIPNKFKCLKCLEKIFKKNSNNAYERENLKQ